jgi:DNA-binding GntR family transcriptional regulator
MTLKHGPPSLSAAAYLMIRDKILSGEYPPGTPVTRRRVSEELGLSLIPVTDALKRLEADGLTESLPRIGTRVKIPAPEEMIGHYRLREALETQSARLFAEHATPRQKKKLVELARNVDSLFSAISTGDFDWRRRLFLFHKSHAEFHMDIARATGCKPLVEAMERSHVLIFNWLYNTAAHHNDLPPRWHKELMEALTGTDPDIADRAMRRHTRFATDEVVQRLVSQAGLPNPQASFRGPQRKTIRESMRKRVRSGKAGVLRYPQSSLFPPKPYGAVWSDGPEKD